MIIHRTAVLDYISMYISYSLLRVPNGSSCSRHQGEGLLRVPMQEGHQLVRGHLPTLRSLAAPEDLLGHLGRNLVPNHAEQSGQVLHVHLLRSRWAAQKALREQGHERLLPILRRPLVVLRVLRKPGLVGLEAELAPELFDHLFHASAS